MVLKLQRFGFSGRIIFGPKEVHEQFITCSLGNSDSPDAYLRFSYAKCDYLLRRSLWQHLYSFSTSTTILWLIGGDFNSVLLMTRAHNRAIPVATEAFTSVWAVVVALVGRP